MASVVIKDTEGDSYVHSESIRLLYDAFEAEVITKAEFGKALYLMLDDDNVIDAFKLMDAGYARWRIGWDKIFKEASYADGEAFPFPREVRAVLDGLDPQTDEPHVELAPDA